MQVKCFLILGSNKGNKLNYILEAKKEIEDKIGVICKQSLIYESDPWGYTDPSKYYNQVIVVSSNAEPSDILRKCLLIEQGMGRTRTIDTYEARTIDIDILFLDHLIINTKDLTVPHPRLHERMFVLKPLEEIFPDFIHPGFNKSIHQLLKECTDTGSVKKIP